MCNCIYIYVDTLHIVLTKGTEYVFIMLHLFVSPYISVKCGGIDTIYKQAPYPRVIRSKTYHGYMKLRIILNAVYRV